MENWLIFQYLYLMRYRDWKQVKTAIEGVYKVHVEKINVVKGQPKRKAYGRYMGIKSGIKKATVTLKEGEKIELFKA